MDQTINPLAADHHLAWFITAPGQSDTLLIAMGIFLIAVIVTIGNLYFQLHALPERWAHRTSPVQIQIVAVLGLLALFTHNHIFWIAALLLAMVQFPDFSTPIYSIADSLSRMAGRGGLENNDAEPSGPELNASAPLQDDADEHPGKVIEVEQSPERHGNEARPSGGVTHA
jgi:hypothetical protein